MRHEVIMAGFGGQGMMLAGQLLAYAGMLEGKYVSWYPSYGPEMRGGTANCTVVVADEPVASPVVSRASAVIAMNRPSLERFEGTLAPGGVLVYNSTLIEQGPTRTDIKAVPVPANALADELGDKRVANMVVLGALLAVTGVAKPESVVASLRKTLPERRQNLIPLNEQALAKGAEAAQGAAAKA
ncbi:MAG: 2-oxoacid:acceptor oxidoreductase family protein [Bacillota bacterium]|nr:2-oxoacid:acceptor oxidoreductase family protein [Bacillota bacterium]